MGKSGHFSFEVGSRATAVLDSLLGPFGVYAGTLSLLSVLGVH